MKSIYLLPLLFLFPTLSGIAQHDTHVMNDSMDMKKKNHHMSNMANDSMQGDSQMHSAFSKNLPMNRNGSGTTWHPDNSPMYMNMWHKKGWMLMLHYGVIQKYSIMQH